MAANLLDPGCARGMVLGHALGDALGAPHEFSYGTPLRAYTGRLAHPWVCQGRYHGRRVGVIGQTTDDTEMAAALLQTVATPAGYCPDGAARAYIAWAQTKPPGMGRNTRALFSGIKTLKGYKERWDAQHTGRPAHSFSQSNGCLMRAYPLALAARPVEAAATDCALTNPHPVCVDACRVYVGVLALLVRPDPAAGRPSFAALQATANRLAETADVRATLEQAWGGGPRDVTYNKGWALHALWCAFRALALLAGACAGPAGAGGPLGYQEVIDWVVRLGGDTDTNAAIAGAVAGAWVGLAGMLGEERTSPNLVTLLECDPAAGELPRPKEYSARRVAELALQFCSASSPLEVGRKN